jgi:hypothetical protein
MKDLGQFAPITTGCTDEIKSASGPTFKPKETGGGQAKGDQGWEADTMATGTYPTHTLTPVTLPDGSTSEATTADDEALSKGGKPKTEDGSPEIAAEEPPETPPAGTDQPDPIPPTKFDLKLPPEFRKLPLSVATAVQAALDKCKDQTWKAALDIIDKAIENHRKMLKDSQAKHRKEAPIKQQKAQAVLEAKIDAKITALEKLQETARKQMAATTITPGQVVAK